MLGKAPKPREPILLFQPPGGEAGGGALYAGPNFSTSGGPLTQLSSGAGMPTSTSSYGMVARDRDIFMVAYNTANSSYSLMKSHLTGEDPYQVWQQTSSTSGFSSITLSFQPAEYAFYSAQSTCGGHFYANICTRSDSDGRAQLVTHKASGSSDGVAWANNHNWSISFNGLGISSAVTPALCSNIFKTTDGRLMVIYRVGATGAFRRQIIGPVYEDLACTVNNAPASGTIRNIVPTPNGWLTGFDATGTGIYRSTDFGVTWNRIATSSARTANAAVRLSESAQSPYVGVIYDGTTSSSSTRQVQAVARNGTVSGIQVLPSATFLYGMTDIQFWKGYWIVAARSSGVTVTYYRTKQDIFNVTTVAGDWEPMTASGLTAGNGLGNAAFIPWN